MTVKWYVGCALVRITLFVATLGAVQHALAAGDIQDQISSTQKQVSKSKRRDQAIVIGHNVTPTTATPKEGVWTAGNYAVGVGVTDSLFIASSPWIWTSYNTANIHLKYAIPVSRGIRVGLFTSYFESYDNKPFLAHDETVKTFSGERAQASVADTNRYQWKSASAHFISSVDVSEDVTTNFNIHFAHFWNDDFPYSIRMDPGRDDIRNQIDITTLTQISIGEGVQWLFELGALGVNYLSPYLQAGSSLTITSNNWLVQLGASFSVPLNEIQYASGWSPGRYDSRMHTTADGHTYRERYLQTALHPELQLQYFF